MTEQQREIERVRSRIAAAILAAHRHALNWWPSRLWHADDLRRSIEYAIGPTAPGSVDRILRDLRQRRLLNYRVVNRRQSLYEWAPVPTEPEQLPLGLGKTA